MDNYTKYHMIGEGGFGKVFYGVRKVKIFIN